MKTQTGLEVKIKNDRIEVLTKSEVSNKNYLNALKMVLNSLGINNSVEHLN